MFLPSSIEYGKNIDEINGGYQYSTESNVKQEGIKKFNIHLLLTRIIRATECTPLQPGAWKNLHD